MKDEETLIVAVVRSSDDQLFIEVNKFFSFFGKVNLDKSLYGLIYEE